MRGDELKKGLIACICEGGAETVIMNILLDNDLLVFSRAQLIEERVLPRVSARRFEERFLRTEYDSRITILRIIDSRAESFPLRKQYLHQVEIVTVVTAPEIEMLIIANEGKQEDFYRSGKQKPSDYCICELQYKDVKRKGFIEKYFSNPATLVSAIEKYNRIHKKKNNEVTLYDLLKKHQQRRKN